MTIPSAVGALRMRSRRQAVRQGGRQRAIWFRRCFEMGATAGLYSSVVPGKCALHCWTSQQWHPWTAYSHFQNTFLDGIYPKPVDQIVTWQSCLILYSVIQCAESLAF